MLKEEAQDKKEIFVELKLSYIKNNKNNFTNK
jgi:hypothetical protein